MAWHVNLASLFSFTALLLQPGKVLRASRQNQLVHLSNSLVLLVLRPFHLYLGILGWKAKGKVTKLLFCEVILKAGEEEDSPVVNPDWLEVLLCCLLLPRNHL